jgi:NAD(P)-dependent dehydrogenase (short-subunit alcohol dehydrogenase family)
VRVARHFADRGAKVVLPFGGALLLGIGVSTQLLPRIGVKVGLTISFLFGATGLFLLGRISTHAGYTADILPGLLLLAFGNGIGLPGLQNAALYQVDATDAGLASGVQNTFLQTGGGLGLSVLVTLGLRHSAGKVAAGVNFLVAELAPAMAGRGQGAIVNLTTMSAVLGDPLMALYGSSKAAVALLTKSWAAEFGPKGVRVNAVSPGRT